LNKEAPDNPGKQIGLIRQFSNTGFFTCEQIASLLGMFSQPTLRVELCVIAFARTIDWHGYPNVTYRLTPFEKRQLYVRVGLINVFDEMMAVDYYELDLAQSASRYVCQEMLHLAAAEPGNNVVGCTLDTIDFNMPSGWLNDVPRRGLLCFYYCREQRVIEKVLQQGAWDHAQSPMYVRETGTVFGPETVSSYTPRWLAEYCEKAPEYGPSPCPQPPNSAWVRPYRSRRIKLKMCEKHQDAKSMFQALDRDGGGSLDRKELAVGLFSLGIWLHPAEIAALLEVLDEDGGGEIDVDEFSNFWETCTFD